MDPTTKEVAIDIGGGQGEFFIERAKREPNKKFIILEPKKLQIDGKPENLHIIQWRSDWISAIPLGPSSVDEANINFLYRQITDNYRDSLEAMEFAGVRYEKLLEDLKLVLKPDGKVQIVDSIDYIDIILKILKRLGYSSEKDPKPLEDWSADWYKEFREEYGEQAHPMLIEAFLKRD